MSHSNHRLVIVTPVYEDLEASTRLFGELAKLFGKDVHVVAVDDGSVHKPLDVSFLEKAGISGTVITLRRNVGHQRAIAIGLDHISRSLSEDQYVVVMDSDGEDMPQTIPTLLDRLVAENVDVVVAQRHNRVETLRFKLFYRVYRWLFRQMTGRSITFGNYVALKPHAVRRLVAMQELPIHVAATVLASKLRLDFCQLDRGPRYAGQSKMNFVGLALHGFKALMIFAEDVLIRIGIACALIAGMSVAGAILAIILKSIGYSTPGWFSVALGILILILLQTGTLALMSLMLTGVMKGGTVAARFAYSEYIERISETRPDADSR